MTPFRGGDAKGGARHRGVEQGRALVGKQSPLVRVAATESEYTQDTDERP